MPFVSASFYISAILPYYCISFWQSEENHLEPQFIVNRPLATTDNNYVHLHRCKRAKLMKIAALRFLMTHQITSQWWDCRAMLYFTHSVFKVHDRFFFIIFPWTSPVLCAYLGYMHCSTFAYTFPYGRLLLCVWGVWKKHTAHWRLNIIMQETSIFLLEFESLLSVKTNNQITCIQMPIVDLISAKYMARWDALPEVEGCQWSDLTKTNKTQTISMQVYAKCYRPRIEVEVWILKVDFRYILSNLQLCGLHLLKSISVSGCKH